MTNMRVKLKLGLAEVEIEGDQDNLHDEALRLLGEMVDMIPIQPEGAAPTMIVEATAVLPETLGSQESRSGNFDFSEDMIATQMGCSSAADVAEAACIHLHFVQNKQEFDRAAILTTMKEAKSFYKQTMTNNLTTTLKSLVKGGSLLSRSSGNYALSNAARTAAEASLAQIS